MSMARRADGPRKRQRNLYLDDETWERLQELAALAYRSPSATLTILIWNVSSRQELEPKACAIERRAVGAGMDRLS